MSPEGTTPHGIWAPAFAGARDRVSGAQREVDLINVAFFLKPKSEVFYLHDDLPLARALHEMRLSGYTSVPVIDRDGHYCGAVNEGDFLRALAQTDGTRLCLSHAEEAERKCVRDILSKDRNPCGRIDEPAESLVSRTTGQNYVPIVDDRGVFIGIVTRRNVIRYFLEDN